jgi:hypothetical protein
MPTRQFANDSMTPDPISVSRDAYKDEIPSDRPMHENATPEHSNLLYTGRQFDTQVKSASSSYGVSVDSSGVSKEAMNIDVHEAKRGKES